MTKDEFIENAKTLLISEEELQRYAELVIKNGDIDLESAPDNYLAVYPFMVALYEVRANWMAKGSLNERVRREIRRKANKLKPTIIWS
jgi:hypothetical protein